MEFGKRKNRTIQKSVYVDPWALIGCMAWAQLSDALATIPSRASAVLACVGHAQTSQLSSYPAIQLSWTTMTIFLCVYMLEQGTEEELIVMD